MAGPGHGLVAPGMGTPAADRRRAGAPQNSVSMAGSSPSPAAPLRATHVAPAQPVLGRGRGRGARTRGVPVEGGDAGVVDGEEEPGDSGVLVEDEGGGDDGTVVVVDDEVGGGEEADDDGPVAEEDEDVGRVAEQDQEAGVGRAGEQDPDDNGRVDGLEQGADGADRAAEGVVVVPGPSAAEAIAAGPPLPAAAAANVKASSEQRSA